LETNYYHTLNIVDLSRMLLKTKIKVNGSRISRMFLITHQTHFS